jgi:hypothetical protein
MSTFTALSGYEVRVLLGPNRINTALAMQFNNLLEDDAKLIVDHYVLARGGMDVFNLPAKVFAGSTHYGDVTPAGQQWRYAAPPTVEWVSPGVASVEVNLVAVHDA